MKTIDEDGIEVTDTTNQNGYVIDIEEQENEDGETELIERWHWLTDEELAEYEAKKEEAEASTIENQLLELQIALVEISSLLLAGVEETSET